MVDTCRIMPITSTTTNPPGHPTDPGKAVPEYGPTVYEGKCKIQNQRGYPSNPDAGGHSWTLGPLHLHLPVEGTAAVATGQLVEILTSFDGSNTGRRFRIRIGDRKTFQSALRVLIEEVVD
jgi:hypothetical protein